MHCFHIKDVLLSSPGMNYQSDEVPWPDLMTLKMQGTYFEAAVTNINPSERALTARFPCHAGLEEFEFTVPYDILIYSVGSKVNTFGIKVVTFQPIMNCD